MTWAFLKGRSRSGRIASWARSLISVVNRPLAKRRFRHAVGGAHRVRLHIGAAKSRLPGWIDTDVYWRASHYLDVTRPWPVAPGSVAHVYGDNVIEHLTLPQGRQMLRGAFGALCPGGRIRLATPDVERIARIYLDEPDIANELLGWHRSARREAAHPVDLLRIYFTHWGHEAGYLYDFASLSDELRDAGFANVTRCRTGESTDPALRDLEARTDAEASIQLIIEAEKPG